MKLIIITGNCIVSLPMSNRTVSRSMGGASLIALAICVIHVFNT
jgi:hypothetical protein